MRTGMHGEMSEVVGGSETPEMAGAGASEVVITVAVPEVAMPAKVVLTMEMPLGRAVPEATMNPTVGHGARG